LNNDLNESILKKLGWKIVGILFLVLGYALAYGGVYLFNGGYKYIYQKLNPPTIEIVLQETAREINKQLPKTIDEGNLRWENVEYQKLGSFNILVYNYTMLNYYKEQIDVEAFTKMQTELIKSHYKKVGKVDYSEVKGDKKYEYGFIYKDKRGEIITSIVLSSNE
jgi:hypothetical protein